MREQQQTTEHAAGAVTAQTERDRPRIYVACLASYNAGILHGRWIDVTDPDEIRGQVAAVLSESPEPGAEEWAIHGATCKSHLLSEVETPLVQPSGPFLTGACGLGNRLVRSLRQRAGNWQPYAGEPPKEKTGKENGSESVLTPRYVRVPRKWLLRGERERPAGAWILRAEGHDSSGYSRLLTRSHLTDAEQSNPDAVRTQIAVCGRRFARAVELRSGCRMPSEANAASRKARGIHNPADRALLNLKGC